MSVKTIVFVGFRKSAITAALALGFEIILWDETPPSKKNTVNFKAVLLSLFPNDDEELSKSLITQLRSFPSIVAVISAKENTVVPAAKLREALKLPGNNVTVATHCHDKYVMKQCAEKSKIQIAPYVFIDRPLAPEQLVDNLGLPIIFKPKDASGSRGIKKIAMPTELASLPIDHLAEKYIEGQQYSIESFIHKGEVVFQNITEYFQVGTCNIMPANIPPGIFKKMNDLNQAVIKAFNIERGMTHLEVYISREDLIFGEIALRPPGGYLMELLTLTYGFNAWQAFIHAEIGSKLNLPAQPTCYSGVWVIHPGEGQVISCEDASAIHNQPCIKSVSLRLKLGDRLKMRQGLGEDYGRIIFSASSHEEIIHAILNTQKKLNIVVLG